MVSQKKYDAFISYSRRDFDEVNAFVLKLRQAIPALRIWFDVDGIESGDEFDEKIIDAIDNSFCVLFALSDHSLQSQWTKDEVMYARNMDVRVIPVLLDGAKLKGWFLFKFGRVDYINSLNQNDVDKLINNFKSWLGSSMEKEPTTMQPDSISMDVTIQNQAIENTFENTETKKTIELDKQSITKVDTTNDSKLVFVVNDVSFSMIKVEGGVFMMGATEEQGEKDPLEVEKPVHKVVLSDYMIGETVVTQALWKAVMGFDISLQSEKGTFDTALYGVGDDYPMYYLSWFDCQDFIKKLNELTGKQFRLPTEAEWEYAARGGKKSKGYKYAGSDTISNVAWYEANSGQCVHPVATKQANELGLYDMSGNVWEWCQNWFYEYDESMKNNPKGPKDGVERMSRGGGWNRIARRCRISYRGDDVPDLRGNVGLRLVL